MKIRGGEVLDIAISAEALANRPSASVAAGSLIIGSRLFFFLSHLLLSTDLSPNLFFFSTFS